MATGIAFRPRRIGPHARAYTLWGSGLLIAAAFLFFLGYPLVSLVARVIDVSAISDAWHQPGIFQVLLNTLILLVAAGSIAIVVAFLFAWLNTRTDARIGRFGNLIVLAPLMVPPIAGTVGWSFLLSPNAGYVNVFLRTLLTHFGLHLTSGPINIFTWPGLIIVSAVYLIPYAFLPISAALGNLDPALEEASTMSGASRLRTLRRVTIPAIAPAVASAGVLVVIIGLSLYAVPAILGPQAHIEVLSQRIVTLLTFSYPPQTGAAVVLGLLVFVLVALGAFAQSRLIRKGNYGKLGGKSSTATYVKLGAWRWPARLITGLFLVCVSIVPFASLLLVSLQRFWTPSVAWSALGLFNFRSVFGGQSLVLDALLRSVELALIGATIGIMVALALTTFGLTAGRRAERAVSFASALPGSLSHIIIYLPQGYFSVSSAVGQIGKELLDASSVSGAKGMRTLRKISVPLASGGMVGGWILIVGLVLSDLTASVLLCDTNNATAGYEILNLYNNGSYPTLASLSVIVSVACAAIFGIGHVVSGKSFSGRA
jgi:iron(III) transport system permease protein